LAAHQELSGHPCVTLHLSASEADAALHVYLEDVAPDGTCRYVTEGMLRALHRKECTAPDYHQVVGPFHSYTRADAAPLVPGEVARGIAIDDQQRGKCTGGNLAELDGLADDLGVDNCSRADDFNRTHDI